MNTLQSKATTSESKNYVIQLQSILNYYNRKSVVQDIKDIDWNHWKNEIATVGLVEKV
jgi:hypothetical protein